MFDTGLGFSWRDRIVVPARALLPSCETVYDHDR